MITDVAFWMWAVSAAGLLVVGGGWLWRARRRVLGWLLNAPSEWH